jgi:hypothetical protein
MLIHVFDDSIKDDQPLKALSRREFRAGGAEALTGA